nr:MAG TPA: hypothetical protein [Caudoviricetes sp.]
MQVCISRQLQMPTDVNINLHRNGPPEPPQISSHFTCPTFF